MFPSAHTETCPRRIEPDQTHGVISGGCCFASLASSSSRWLHQRSMPSKTPPTGPTIMARIGVMRALNRHVERVFNPERKDTHLGKAEYRGGNDLLWSLRTLRNLDIHETVVPIASTISGADFVVTLSLAETGQIDS